MDAQYVADLREALTKLYDDTAAFIKSNESMPTATSQAATEHATYCRPESIVTAHALGTQLLEYGGDHLTAFVKLITNESDVIATWTCVRSMLESSAISAWLLDPTIDAHTRVGRTFAHRYEGLIQQLKYGRARHQSVTEIIALETHINKVETDAAAAGFAPLRDSKGRRIGIGQVMPGATDMIKTVLNEELAYRLLSAVAHAHHWALMQINFKVATGTAAVDLGGFMAHKLEKVVDAKALAYLGARVLFAFTRPLWNQCQYFGWDQLKLEEIIENAADKMHLKGEPRYWRPQEHRK
jgi:hypothetical protein